MKVFKYPTRINHLGIKLLGLLLLLIGPTSIADISSAMASMEDSQNPLLLMQTSQGELYLELFPREAPVNVAKFMDLAAGEQQIIDRQTLDTYKPEYFNNSRFHRVIPGLLIQAGSPDLHPIGAPLELIDDEINALALGLDKIAAIQSDGSISPLLNLANQQDFEENILIPLYKKMRIADAQELRARQSEIQIRLSELTVQSVFENLGYRYTTEQETRAISRGIVALANSGPNSNGPEFFIALSNANFLTGRYTVIGKVIEGMSSADNIGRNALERRQTSALSTSIYTIKRVN